MHDMRSRKNYGTFLFSSPHCLGTLCYLTLEQCVEFAVRSIPYSNLIPHLRKSLLERRRAGWSCGIAVGSCAAGIGRSHWPVVASVRRRSPRVHMPAVAATGGLGVRRSTGTGGHGGRILLPQPWLLLRAAAWLAAAFLLRCSAGWWPRSVC